MTQMDRPLVTLAVKTYQQETLVREAVLSAFAQTYPYLEILLSDDASRDGTWAILNELAQAYDGPHVVRLNRNPSNLGIVGHCNRLWSLASGELYLECAGDDVAEPEKVERLVEVWAAGEGRVAAVHSRAVQIDMAGRSLGDFAPDPAFLSDAGARAMIEANLNGIGATALFDRRVFDVFGPIHEGCFVEDGALFFRAALLGEIVYIDAPLTRYRIGGLSYDADEHDRAERYLRGRRMQRALWWHANAQGFLDDLDKLPRTPEREVLRGLCRDLRARDEVELAVWRAKPLRRWLLLPWAAGKAAAARRPRIFVQALKQALGPLYEGWYRLRWGADFAVPDAPTETQEPRP